MITERTEQWTDASVAFKSGNYAVAARLLRPLAERGDVVAQFSLGYLYDTGQGVEKNHAVAVEWIIKAAAGGYAEAQYALGCHYVKGEGVPQDYVQAYFWLTLAAEQIESYQPNPTANQVRDSFKSKMAVEEIVRAEKQANDWQRI